MIFNIAYMIVAGLLLMAALLTFRYRHARGYFVATLLIFGVMNIVFIFSRH